MITKVARITYIDSRELSLNRLLVSVHDENDVLHVLLQLADVGRRRSAFFS